MEGLEGARRPAHAFGEPRLCPGRRLRRPGRGRAGLCRPARTGHHAGVHLLRGGAPARQLSPQRAGGAPRLRGPDGAHAALPPDHHAAEVHVGAPAAV